VWPALVKGFEVGADLRYLVDIAGIGVVAVDDRYEAATQEVESMLGGGPGRDQGEQRLQVQALDVSPRNDQKAAGGGIFQVVRLNKASN